MTTNKNQLRADTVTGVYVGEVNETYDNTLFDDDFYTALADPFTGTIYGVVNDEIAAKIEAEYGIR